MVAEKTQKKFNRKQLMINPKFQYSLILHTIVLATLVILIFFFSHLFIFWKFAQMTAAMGFGPEHPVSSLLEQLKHFSNAVFAFTAAAGFGIILLGGVFLSHKIAGPIYRMMKSLDEISQGKALSEIHFRKGDYFPELADKFNAFLSKRGK